MDKKFSGTFLARWLNNELTSEELKDFKQSPDFLLYQKIADKASELQGPAYNKERVFQKTKAQLSVKKPTKIRTLVRRISYAAAAAVILFMGMQFFVNLPEKHTTGFGEQLTITLPDNSKVRLNSKTTIEYQKDNWAKNRTITLDGEAYFEVEKGSQFTVETTAGSVAVLGTKFNVKKEEDFFEVICYEGKVAANTQDNSEILTKGNAFRKQKDVAPEKWNVLHKEPTWKHGESSFKSVPLKYVIKALENQYKITFNTSKINVEKKFTGSFTHNNLKTALQTVFVPMKIGITFMGEKTVVLEAVNE
jgi:ferric-dicitrate binding protein FerR (iron transport regulator)